MSLCCFLTVSCPKNVILASFNVLSVLLYAIKYTFEEAVVSLGSCGQISITEKQFAVCSARPAACSEKKNDWLNKKVGLLLTSEEQTNILSFYFNFSLELRLQKRNVW